jgi:hypothetical protein
MVSSYFGMDKTTPPHLALLAPSGRGLRSWSRWRATSTCSSTRHASLASPPAPPAPATMARGGAPARPWRGGAPARPWRGGPLGAHARHHALLPVPAVVTTMGCIDGGLVAARPGCSGYPNFSDRVVQVMKNVTRF